MRENWSFEEGLTYLNHGAYGATPNVVIQEQNRFRAELENNPTAFFGLQYPKYYQSARDKLAEFLNANQSEIFLTENATAGVNTVLRGIDFEHGDRIVTTSYAYGPLRGALSYLRDRYGVEVEYVDIPFPLSDEAEIAERVSSALTPSVKLLFIDHVASATGVIFPLQSIIAAANENGVPTLVDGAHAPGMIPLNLRELGATWYVGNCHKWMCAPKGAAFLYSQSEHELSPLSLSRGYGSGRQAEFEWIGTRDASAWFSIPAALRFLEGLPLAEAQQRNIRLADDAAKLFSERWGVPRTAPRSALAAMETLPLPGEWGDVQESSRKLMRWLYEEHKFIAQFYPFDDRLWFRISAQVYNKIDDFQRLSEILSVEELKRISQQII